NFIIAKRVIDKGDVFCPADGRTGLSASTASTCISYVATSFQIVDANKRKITVGIGSVPVFTAFNPPLAQPSFTTVTSIIDFPVYVSGYPAPTVTVDPNFPVPTGCSLLTRPAG